VGDIDFQVTSIVENSNKFQKTGFWKEKSVEDMVTIGPMAQATLVFIIFIKIYQNVIMIYSPKHYCINASHIFYINSIYHLMPWQIYGCYNFCDVLYYKCTQNYVQCKPKLPNTMPNPNILNYVASS